MVTGYMVINSSHLRSLEALVFNRILQGWEPIGGVHSVEQKTIRERPICDFVSDKGVVITDVILPSDREWYQAMVYKNVD